MTRAKDISKIVTDADLSGTLDVAGTVTADGADISGGADSVGELIISQGNTSTKVSKIVGTDTGGTNERGIDFNTFYYADYKRMTISAEGNISFYEDTGTTPKLFWDASAEALGIGTSSPSSFFSDSKLVVGDGTGTPTATIYGSTTGTSYLLFADGTLSTAAYRGGLEYSHASDFLGFFAAGVERMRIDGIGHLLVGTTTSFNGLNGRGDIVAGNGSSNGGMTIYTGSSNQGAITFADGTSGDQAYRGMIEYDHSTDSMAFKTAVSERMRITSAGEVAIGKTTNSFSTAGSLFPSNGKASLTVDGDECINCNRLTSDGNLIRFYQAGTEEGNISVSGTTVSYNGGHLSRWSRLLDNSKDTSIVKGTVMTNLNEMVEWGDEDNEQLNKMAVSSVEGDANVAGVFVNWDDDDDWNDMNIAMTGDMVIRIAQGTTVARGDLLMSAGDGTAKPQGDDIVRSKTIAKVTSTNVSHTYDDGTYLVPCVLMAC